MARWFLPNAGFELGDKYWSDLPEWSIVNDAGNARTGAWVGRWIGADAAGSILLPAVGIRPGGIINASVWIKGGTAGSAHVRAIWFDHAGAVVATANGTAVGAGSPYTQSSAVFTAPDRTKSVQLGVFFDDVGGQLDGTWFVDDMDASGDIIESLPSSAIISGNRMITADTVGVFDPLIGEDKFTDFNAGMSDRWAGSYTFVPALGQDLGDLVTFLRRLGRKERFFAFDDDRKVPLGGVVNGMVVDAAVNGGNTRIPISGGPSNAVPLVRGDYVEIRRQFFQVQRDLETGPLGTGDLIVWPAVRATLTAGEDVITDNPKLVAQVTSNLDWRRVEARPSEISISWHEV